MDLQVTVGYSSSLVNVSLTPLMTIVPLRISTCISLMRHQKRPTATAVTTSVAVNSTVATISTDVLVGPGVGGTGVGVSVGVVEAGTSMHMKHIAMIPMASKTTKILLGLLHIVYILSLVYSCAGVWGPKIVTGKSKVCAPVVF